MYFIHIDPLHSACNSSKTLSPYPLHSMSSVLTIWIHLVLQVCVWAWVFHWSMGKREGNTPLKKTNSPFLCKVSAVNCSIPQHLYCFYGFSYCWFLVLFHYVLINTRNYLEYFLFVKTFLVVYHVIYIRVDSMDGEEWKYLICCMECSVDILVCPHGLWYGLTLKFLDLFLDIWFGCPL